MFSLSMNQSSGCTGIRSRAALRTAHACRSCKKRRIKCTGQPGPCQACSKNGNYCHFDAKLDARRKISYKSSTVHQHQIILKSLLLSIKFNHYALMQRLVEAIRNNDSPPNVAKALQNNIQALHERGELTKEDISNNDMITLVSESLSCSQPRSRTSSTTSTLPHDLLGQSSSSPSELSSVSLATNEDLSMDDTLPIQIQSSNSDAGQCSIEPAYSFTDFESIFTSNAFESSDIPVNSKNFDSSTSLLTSIFPQIADFEAQMALCENLSQNHHFWESNTLQFSGVRWSWPL